MLTHLSLFSGIGGLDLAAERAGFTTVGQCEWADYPTKVLEKHWPDVPRWRDIRMLTGDDFYARTGLRTVDVISGGFPCQPFSVAGKQKGKGDDRYLWPEMCRVIAELAPRCVVGENVPGILRIAAADVVSDLERLGYQTVVFDFEAAAVGAHHRRERVAFVAYRDGTGLQEKRAEQQAAGTAGDGQDVADAHCWELRDDCDNRRETAGEEHETSNAGHAGREEAIRDAQSSELPWERRAARDWWTVLRCASRWPAEPNVGRVAHGVPHRVDRIKCLGNAVVPAQFFPIFRALNIVLTEEEMQCTR